jgi:hypothetical protein
MMYEYWQNQNVLMYLDQREKQARMIQPGMIYVERCLRMAIRYSL